MYTFSNIEISDLYKDVYEFRPSDDYLLTWKQMSDDDKQTEWDRLVNKL